MTAEVLTGKQVYDELQARKVQVDVAIEELDGAIQEKLKAEDAYEKAKAIARIKSVAEDIDGKKREKDHDAFVSQQTDHERFQAALKKEMLKFYYDQLKSRRAQLSSTQTQAKIYSEEMSFVRVGPEF